MKKFFIILITIYQVLISPIIKLIIGINRTCRFSISCSEYAKQSILSYGIARGTSLSVKRLISCQPFSN